MAGPMAGPRLARHKVSGPRSRDLHVPAWPLLATSSPLCSMELFRWMGVAPSHPAEPNNRHGNTLKQINHADYKQFGFENVGRPESPSSTTHLSPAVWEHLLRQFCSPGFVLLPTIPPPRL